MSESAQEPNESGKRHEGGGKCDCDECALAHCPCQIGCFIVIDPGECGKQAKANSDQGKLIRGRRESECRRSIQA